MLYALESSGIYFAAAETIKQAQCERQTVEASFRLAFAVQISIQGSEMFLIWTMHVMCSFLHSLVFQQCPSTTCICLLSLYHRHLSSSFHQSFSSLFLRLFLSSPFSFLLYIERDCIVVVLSLSFISFALYSSLPVGFLLTSCLFAIFFSCSRFFLLPILHC